jgi:hypothetical protein
MVIFSSGNWDQNWVLCSSKGVASRRAASLKGSIGVILKLFLKKKEKKGIPLIISYGVPLHSRAIM